MDKRYKTFEEIEAMQEGVYISEPSRHERILGRIVLLMAFLSAIHMIGLVFTAQAGATEGCTHSIQFSDPPLLNRDGDDVGTWVDTDIPAGQYAVTLFSSDPGHITDPTQQTQPQEQWVLELDGGDTIGPTVDIADESEVAFTGFETMSISHTTAVRPAHLRAGDSINSVSADSACFTAIVPELVVVEQEGLVPAVPLQVIQEPVQLEEMHVQVVVEHAADMGPVVEVAEVQVTEEAGQAADVVTPELALTGPTSAQWAFIVGISLLLFGIAYEAARLRLDFGPISQK